MANPLKAVKKGTNVQRAFGGGRRIGKQIGRRQGAAAGLGAGLTVAAIREQLLKIAAEEKKTTRTVPRNSQSPKPRLRPQEKAKGGAVKMKSGGTPAVASPTAKRIIPSSEPPWLIQMKKEADKLGIPLRELLTMHNNKGPKKPKAKGKKASMKAAKGGYTKKK